MCAFIFNDKEPSEKTLPKAKALFYLLFEQLDEAKKKKAKAAKRGVAHFTFTKALSKFFEALDDLQAGLLIKQCSNYVFGMQPLEDNETTQVDEYFELIKPMLDKTIKQRENAKRHNENRKKPKITSMPLSRRMRTLERSLCIRLSIYIDRKAVCKCKRATSHLQTEILKRRKGNAVFGHRSRKHMRSLTSQGKTVGIHCFESTLLTPLQARTQLMSAANKCRELHLCAQAHNVEANNK